MTLNWASDGRGVGRGGCAVHSLPGALAAASVQAWTPCRACAETSGATESM